MKRTGILLADIHIKAQDYQQTYKEYKFLEEYLNDKTYDFCIILGDFFDRKIYSYEDYIELAYQYMALLINHSKKIRVIYGTRSHENDQYEIFNFLNDNIMCRISKGLSDLDFKVIKSVEEEELYPDLKVLYLPEEYLMDKNKYYEEYFNTEKKYDYVFGHGVIKEVMTMVESPTKKVEKIKGRKKPPVFTTGELKRITKGQVFFGHYHIQTNISNKVFYVGSLSRYHFGEEEPKGFYEIETDGEEYNQTFIENQVAKKYITIKYGYKHEIFFDQEKLFKELELIPKKKKNAGIDYLRLIFNIPENYKDSEFVINLINEKFKFSDDIKIEIVNGYIEKKRSVNREQASKIFDQYDIIFDKNEGDETKISFYIKEKYGRDIPPETVKKYLSFKAVEILQDE